MSHSHIEDCIHCGCNNPVFNILHDNLKSKNIDSLKIIKKGLKNKKTKIKNQNNESSARIYYGGTIRPMINGNTDKVEAIAFYNGIVISSGKYKKVKRKLKYHLECSRNTNKKIKKIKLKCNETLLPGFIEAHAHVAATVITSGKLWCNLGPYKNQRIIKDYNLEYIKNNLNSFIKNLKNDKKIKDDFWVLGQGVDPALMPFKGNNLIDINIELLDKIETKRPILLMSASLHTAYVNTLALKKIYASHYANNPKSHYKNEESYISAMSAQGALQESEQIMSALTSMPTKQSIMLIKNFGNTIKDTINKALKAGITTFLDASMTSSFLKYFNKFFEHNEKKIRLAYAPVCTTLCEAKNLAPYKQVKDIDQNMFPVIAKLISDGSNQGLTGYQNAPYLCNQTTPLNYGVFNFSNVDNSIYNYTDIATTIDSKGWPIMIHANGDKAIDQTLDVYEKVLEGKDKNKLKKVWHRIEHCSLLDDNRINRMQKLSISPSFLIGHVGYWGYSFKEIIFREKATTQLDRCKSMINKDAVITLHSDYGVSPLGPLRLMEQAVTRIMEHTNGQEINPKEVLNKEEKISREEGLRAITINAAKQCQCYDFIGDLKDKKKADYLILENDPLTISDPTKIRDICVKETWIGGKKIKPYKI